MTKTQTILPATVLILLLLAVLTTPPASAQEIPVGCNVIGVAASGLTGSTIDPIAPGEVTSVDVVYEYETSALAWSLHPIQVDFSATGAPAWADISVTPQTIFIVVEPGSPTSESQSLTVTIALDAHAPVGEHTTFQVEALAHEGTCVTSAQAVTEMSFSVTHDDHCE